MRDSSKDDHWGGLRIRSALVSSALSNGDGTVTIS
jgi:hypothetical protein